MWCAWDFVCLAAGPMAGTGRIVSPAGVLGNGIGGWFFGGPEVPGGVERVRWLLEGDPTRREV